MSVTWVEFGNNVLLERIFKNVSFHLQQEDVAMRYFQLHPLCPLHNLGCKRMGSIVAQLLVIVSTKKQLEQLNLICSSCTFKSHYIPSHNSQRNNKTKKDWGNYKLAKLQVENDCTMLYIVEQTLKWKEVILLYIWKKVLVKDLNAFGSKLHA